LEGSAAAAPEAEHDTFEIDDTNVALEEPVEPAPELTVSPADLVADTPEFEPEPELDSDLASLAGVEDAAPEADSFEQPDEIAVDSEPDEVLLTQLAADDELFDDPNLDVAGVAPGEEREIVIPVEIGAEGETKRFKLSVRLRLDPVD
jgi:hypothetical protein